MSRDDSRLGRSPRLGTAALFGLLHVPRVHPGSAHVLWELRVSAPGPRRFSPNHRAHVVRVLTPGCTKRHQENPGKVRETIQKADERARSKYSDIDGISVLQKSCKILDRRSTALIESPTELDTLVLWSRVQAVSVPPLSTLNVELVICQGPPTARSPSPASASL